MGWEAEVTISAPNFVADKASVVRTTGRQIDWDQVTETNDAGDKIVIAGTIVAQTAAATTVFPRTNIGAAETAIGILETDAVAGAGQDALSGYGMFIGGSFYDELLPDIGDAAIATMKTELGATGGSFYWQTLADSSAA